MRVRRGDIVSVDLGGEDDDDTRGGEIYKTRPGVVVQNDVGNANSPTTIIAPISGGHTGYPFHVHLPASTPGLGTDSHVQLDQIRTVDIQARNTDRIGRVAAGKMDEVDDALRISLGL